MFKVVTREEFEDQVALLINQLERDDKLQDSYGIQYDPVKIICMYLYAYGYEVPPIW